MSESQDGESPAASDTIQVGGPAGDVSSSASLAVGRRMGRYVVLEVLGRGAMGEVLRAYDPKLRRELAIKRILPTTLPAEAEARLVREAQAMAQLGHPNVVSVYDVDVTEHGVVVAMEYVRGTTLEKWLRDGKRSWREIVAAFQQAGRGLHAAHESGLVHRDFKPANVLVAEDGRVRVADFGLVRVAEPERSSLEGASIDESIDRAVPTELAGVKPTRTEANVVLGTPRYMAPEQLRGTALAASDQYAFCVALWEAFVGKPPHRGSFEDLAVLKHRGPPAWPRGVAIPRRIIAAILRGLSPRPADRFPSMQELVNELGRDASARRRSLAIGGAAIVAGSVALYALQASTKCSGGQEQLDASWSSALREQVQQAFAATALPISDSAWTSASTKLDDYAQRWAAQYEEACEATTVRGEQSTEVMDLRMACLSRARGELNAIVGVFVQADATTVERSHRLLEGLPGLERCEDIAALSEDVAPPAAGPMADAVAAAREDLARSRALYRLGKYEESLALADDVDARTRDLDYPPIHAEAALGRGDVLDYLGRYDESEAALRRALEIALRRGSLDVAIKAATSLVYVVGSYLGRPAEAQWMAHLGVDLAHRVRADGELEARARNSMGYGYRLLNRWDDADREYREAIRRLEQAVGARDTRVATLYGALGALLTEACRYDLAEVELQHSLELRRELLGPTHPDTANAAETLAYVLVRYGRLREAEALLRDGLAARIEAHGPDHFFTARARSELAFALSQMGRHDEALRELETAVEGMKRSLPADHRGFIDPMHHYAFALARVGRLEEAETQARSTLDISEKVYDPTSPHVAEEIDLLAGILVERGELEEAEKLARRAIAIFEPTRGIEHALTYQAKATLGEILLLKGSGDALPLLEKVWAFREHAGIAPQDKAQSAFALARALESGGTRPERATTLARMAEGDYARAGAGYAREVESVERWIARPP